MARDMEADLSAGEQHRRLARLAGGVEHAAHALHELAEAGRRHGELAVLRWPDQSLGEGALPFR